MKGHVIVERVSKEGWIFIPEAHLRLNIIVLEDEAVVHALKTYPVGTTGVYSDNLEEKIYAECDFVRELEVPPEILRWAQYAIERNDRWNEALRASAETDPKEKRAIAIEKEPRAPPELKLSKAARFEIYRRIQGWILEAGGLL
ncbi:MAG TPA: hypothetical protein VHD38_00950 [Candidatus Paceibacterota bacterium]|nr:hypothetical protein [Candidatus Paceibacterota bacterium]